MGGSGGGESEEDFDMSAYVTGAHWEGDVLFLEYGPCCKKAVARQGSGGGGGTDTEPGGITDIIWDDPLDAVPTDYGWENPPGGPSLACRKAWAIGSTLDTLFTAMADYEEVNIIEGANWLRSLVPQLDLSLGQGIALATMSISYAFNDIWASDTWGDQLREAFICMLSRNFVDSLAMTADEFDFIETALSLMVPETENKPWLLTAFNLINKSQIRSAIAALATSTEADCSCPSMGGIPEIPVAYDWYAWLNFAADDCGFVATGDSALVYVPGEGWKVDIPSHIWAHLGMKRDNVGTGSGNVVYIRHEFSEIPTAGRLWWPEGLKINGTGYWTWTNLSLMPPYRTYIENTFNSPPGYTADKTWEWDFGQVQQIDGQAAGNLVLSGTLIAGTGVNPFSE